MRILFIVFCFSFLVSSCGNRRSNSEFSPVGKWQNPKVWNNNKITLTVREDSVMLFKAEQRDISGTRFFVSIGKWNIEQDSFLVMKPFTDGRHYELRELFPELVQVQMDSQNVTSVEMEAKLIMADHRLYNLGADGKRAVEEYYEVMVDSGK